MQSSKEEKRGEEEVDDPSSSTSLNDEKKDRNNTTLDRTMTAEQRQLLHPLELNDKLAFETIKTVRLASHG